MEQLVGTGEIQLRLPCPEVVSVLRSIGLAHLAPRFADADIDAAVFWSLSDGDLRELGLTLGQRKKLIERLTAGPTAQPVGGFELRRLTILFSDLVGFTELSVRIDPDDVRTILERYYAAARQVIESLGGHIAALQGDGIVALFGYPASLGSDAERAVAAALALQGGIAGISHRMADGQQITVAARIGIASGKTVVGRTEGPTPGQGVQIIGPAVNRAARLQALAEPGTVVVDEETYGLAGSASTFLRLPDARLKGFDGLAQVWQAQPPGQAAPPPSRPAPQILRSAHLRESDRLAEAWAAACRHQSVLVLLSGEAGIGKSTLLNEITARAKADGARVLRLTCAAVASHTPLRPVIQHLESLLAEAGATSPRSRMAALRSLLGEVADADLMAVASLLGLAEPMRTAASATEDRARLLSVLARFLMDGTPRLVAVEDLHWADATTRELIGLCATHLPKTGVLIVATSRQRDQALWAGDPRHIDLALTPLDPGAASAVLAHHLKGRRLPDSIAEAIISRSDGNPLMLEALARSVEGRDDAALREAFQVPASIYESIAGRLDMLRLGRQAVAALAVFDEPTDAATLAHALGLAPGDLDEALAELAETGIIAPSGDGPRRRLQFQHSLYREVGYERLVKSARKALHKAVYGALTETLPEVDRLRPGLLAWHAAEAEEYATAAPLALLAGEQALSRSALIEADHFLRQALAALDLLQRTRPHDLLRLRALVGQASISRARLGIASDEAGALGRQVLELAQRLGERRSEMIALNGLYAHALVRSDYRAAGDWAVRLRETAEVSQDRTFRMIGDRGLGVVALHTGALDQAATLLRQALDSYDEAQHLPLAHAHGYDHAEICAAFLSFTLWSRGDPAEARRISAFSVDHSRRIAHAHSLAQALAFRAMLSTLARDTATAIACAAEAEEVSARHGLPAMGGAGVFFGKVAHLLAQDGPPDRAVLDDLQAAHARFRQFNPYNYGPLTGALMAGLFLRAGDSASAARELDQADALQDSTGETWMRPELMRLRGQVLAAGGAGEAAQYQLVAALEAAEACGARMLALRIACDLCEMDRSAIAMARLQDLRGRMVSTDGGWDDRRSQAVLAAFA